MEKVPTGIYARVSSEREEQEHALIQQLERLRAAAGGDAVCEYIDIASGSRDDRRQLAQLMRDCRSGKLDTVICTRLDRMSRSMAHGAKLLEYFCADDTPNLIALDDGLDLETVGGRFVARMLINLAQAETERLSERIRHGITHRQEGLQILGRPPFGYRLNSDHSNIELDPATAPVARRLVDLFLREKLMRPVLRHFSQQGIHPFISTHGFKNWLLNPTLAGFRVYGTYESYRDQTGRKKRRKRPEGQYQHQIPNANPALITCVEHARIKAIFSDQRFRRHSGLLKHRANLLTGLTICGHCQRCMGYQFGNTCGGAYLRCVTLNCSGPHYNRIRADVVEAAIWAALNQQKVERRELSQQKPVNNWEAKKQQLEAEIGELVARDDPDYNDTIQRKRERLQLLLYEQSEANAVSSGLVGALQALGEAELWQRARQDKRLARLLFVELVERVEIWEQQVHGVTLRHLPANARLTSSDP